MNVLHVIPSSYPATYYGGAIVSTWNLVNALASQGITVRVLTTDADGPCRSVAVERDGEVVINSRLRVTYCKRVFNDSVAPTLLLSMPSCVKWADVVHLTAVYSFPTIPTLLACRKLAKPVVWSPRGSLQRWAGSTKPRLKAMWERLCDVVAPKKVILHVTSLSEGRESRERFPRFNAVVVPNGVDVPINVNRVAGNGSLRLLFLGRLHPKKGIENLLEACHLLDEGGRLHWSLTIAGAGEAGYAEGLQAKVHSLGLSHKVAMVGEVAGSAKQGLFEHADLLLVPSFTENFALVVAESLAHGVPVIASRGTPWAGLERMGCGLWVEQDPDSLARAIEHAAQMPLSEMGKRGREWMKHEFSWDSIGGRMTQLYRDAMAFV